MEYVETVKRINEILKQNRAAISEICRRAGQHGNSAYYNALKKTDWTQLSVAQREVIEAALEYIQHVKEGNPDPTAIRAAEVLN